MRCWTRMVLIAVLIAFFSSETPAWEPADGPLMTRWAKDVSPERVWPEYPRPQMVREAWVNLNGLWEYAIRPASEAQPSAWDGEILVPFPVESALSGVMKPVQPDERLWYRRTFEAPTLPEGGRLLVHFGAVDWKCQVFVNGEQVGEHQGGYDPFTFDVTDALKPGENELVVAVEDPTDTGDQPRGKQVLKPHGIMYTAVTGIWQTVWLEPVPAKHIKSLKVTPDLDSTVVVVKVDASSADGVRVRVLSDGEKVADELGRVGEAMPVVVQNAKRWSPDDPHLYDLEVELLDGEDTIIDKVDSYFGMRKIEVRKDDAGINRLMLNNEVLFQYGPLDQGWWPDGLYTPPSDEAMKYDIEMTKKFGMNMARKHVKVEPARWYYWCDRLGLLVWQDMPSGHTAKTAESRVNFKRELQAMLDALHHFPSIVMWVPFNEGWGQHETPEIAGWVKEYDQTRPVNEASGWHDHGSGDVADMHNYPGPGMREPEADRVSVLGEFGGLGLPVAEHTWQPEENWGYVSYTNAEDLTNAYVDLLTKMRPLIGRGLAAAVYTQTTDVEIEVNGLMTYDRAVVKMDLDRITEAARKLYLPPPLVRTLVPTSEEAPQTWRYTTSEPANDWFSVDCDDSSWEEGPGGFGTKDTPGAVVRTVWNSPDIWIRRSFELDELPGAEGALLLRAHHDERAEVYLNGKPVHTLKRYATGYTMVALDEEARQALRVGRNTLAVHCHQTEGGQYIDVGLAEMVER